MSERRFNEDSLRAEIVKVWGEHGAHVEVFDRIVALARRQVVANEVARRAGAVSPSSGTRET